MRVNLTELSIQKDHPSVEGSGKKKLDVVFRWGCALAEDDRCSGISVHSGRLWIALSLGELLNAGSQIILQGGRIDFPSCRTGIDGSSCESFEQRARVETASGVIRLGRFVGNIFVLGSETKCRDDGTEVLVVRGKGWAKDWCVTLLSTAAVAKDYDFTEILGLLVVLQIERARNVVAKNIVGRVCHEDGNLARFGGEAVPGKIEV